MEDKLNAKILQEKKHAILELIKSKGPSLPIMLSREINLSLLFTSAMLSDLISEKQIKYSHLKVGGSPLYFISGQEQMLDNFTKHLELKEREALALLQQKKVVADDSVEPAFRVAYRNIKDFAMPIVVKTEEGDKRFWRVHTTVEDEALKLVDEMIRKYKPKAKDIKEEKKDERKEERKEEKKKEVREEKNEEIQVREIKRENVKAKGKKEKGDFVMGVYEHLKQNSIEVEKQINADDVICVVLTKFDFGKTRMLVIASNKKKINEADLSLAYHQGQHHKMPVLFLTSGELTKKAQGYMEMFGNYIFVKRI